MAHLSVQQFIEAWEKSISVTEVAQKTRLTKPTVQAKATQLRKLGIPLKKFRGARHRINVEEALAFLAKIRGTFRRRAQEGRGHRRKETVPAAKKIGPSSGRGRGVLARRRPAEKGGQAPWRQRSFALRTNLRRRSRSPIFRLALRSSAKAIAMTVYEHAMLGIDGALAAGLQRRHGWQIVALAGVAALLPDFDGLTILLGLNCYAEGHRVSAHDLLVAGLAAAVVAGLAYGLDAPGRVQRWLAGRGILPSVAEANGPHPGPLPRGEGIGNGPHSNLLQRGEGIDLRGGVELALWLAVGVLAAYSHLLADVFFSAGKGQPVWGVPLGWPFSAATWAYPMVPWGDIGTTVIFAAGMFAMLRWRAWTQAIAAGTLAAVAAYVVVRGVVFVGRIS